MKVVKATGSPAPSDNNQAVEMTEIRSLTSPSELVQDGITDVMANNELLSKEVDKMSSLSATMWLGSQSGRSDHKFLIYLILYVQLCGTQWLSG